jgi:biopolymer transport protein ExbD
VLLTLIIVFMLVVASEQDQKGERALIPQPAKQSTPEEQQSRTIIIQVLWTAEDQPPILKINQEDVTRENLGTRLQQIFLTRAEKVAFVRGDNDVNYEDIADVIDVARHAGVDRVGLLTKEQVQ